MDLRQINKKISKLFRGFTLVELIVVISVLAVLATIAMSQIGNITSNARDSQRLTDMSTIKFTLENYNARTSRYPAPSSGVAVTYSG